MTKEDIMVLKMNYDNFSDCFIRDKINNLYNILSNNEYNKHDFYYGEIVEFMNYISEKKYAYNYDHNPQEDRIIYVNADLGMCKEQLDIIIEIILSYGKYNKINNNKNNFNDIYNVLVKLKDFFYLSTNPS